MDLFGYDPAVNLLPCDGTVNYYGPVLDPGGAQRYYEALLQHVPWKNDEVIVFGKHHVTARKVAWFGDPGFSYSYSGTTKQALPWTAELLELKTLVEQLSGARFNSCLLNLYHHGGEGMGWHSDDEKELDQAAPIASVSFGGERKFAFKHKSDRTSVSLTLANGSVLLMHTPTQQFWQHSLTKTKRAVAPRINLTFRAIRHDHH